MSITDHEVVVEQDGRLSVPVEVVRAAGLEPGTPVVFEATEEGFFAQSKRFAEAEDQADVSAYREALADPNNGERRTAEQVKQHLNL